MRIAHVHYHLKRGGVTRVIENAAAALTERGHEVVVLSGEAYAGDAPLRSAVVEGLDYRPEVGDLDPTALATQLQAKATEILGGAPEVWHIHNHSLGKNVAFLEVLHHLLHAGARLLLQVHDFAEDGRPAQYRRLLETYQARREWGPLAGRLYPAANQVHYAVLNARDADHLARMGISPEHLHLLPNPVAVPDLEAPEGEQRPFPEAKQFFLYPTRAIRRKNVGELLLLSMFAPTGSVFGLTLSPENPEWLPIYHRWRDFAAQLRLPVEFGVAEQPGASFPALVRRADALVTTSVAEGFGLAFLEPWLFGKGLVGRDLPGITDDFKAAGVEFPDLYGRLDVPLGLVGEGPLRIQLEKELKSTYAAYGHRAPRDAVERCLETAIQHKRIDFGRLSEPFQERVLNLLRESPAQAADLWRPKLRPADPSLVQRNQERIAAQYNLGAYGRRLESIYQGLTEAEAGAIGAHDATALLALFLDPARFTLLRA